MGQVKSEGLYARTEGDVYVSTGVEGRMCNG
jgi:hypothetical protein